MNTDNRRREIARFPIPGSDDVSVVTVSYPTFADAPRVYSLTVQPTTIERDDYGAMYRYTPGEGYRLRLEAAPRYSARKLEALAADPAILAQAQALHARILAARGIVGGIEYRATR